jgi:hypothetical protein
MKLELFDGTGYKLPIAYQKKVIIVRDASKGSFHKQKILHNCLVSQNGHNQLSLT